MIVNTNRVDPNDKDKYLTTTGTNAQHDFIRDHEFKLKKFEEDRRRAMNEFQNDQKLNTQSSWKSNKIIPENDSANAKKLEAEATYVEREHIKKSHLLKEKFFEWGTNSTAHGIPNMIRLESRILKIIWFVCFLASLSYCAYTIVSIIITYLQFDVLINQEVVSKSPVDFPAVTVCNLNAFDKRNAQKFINQTLAKNNISYVSDVTKIDMSPTLVNNLIKASIIGNKNFTKKDYVNLGFTIDYMLLTCYFNNIPCNSSDFVWRYDYDYTNCYTFNSGYDMNGNPVPIKQVNEAGSDRSLKLELFIGDDATQSQYMLNSGARVVVHNQTITPIINSEGI